MDHYFTGVLQFCSDSAERVGSFADSKSAFNISALAGFEPFLTKFLPADFRILRRLAQPGAVHADAMRFAVSEVLAVAKARISQNPFRVMPIGLSIRFHRSLKGCAFVECVPTEMFDPQETVDVAHLDLGAEFDVGILLPTLDRAHPGLAQTDNAVIDPVGIRFIHLPLLFIQQPDDGQTFDFPTCQRLCPVVGMLLDRAIDGFQVAPEEVQLLLSARSDAFEGFPAALGESVEPVLCDDAVRSRFPAVGQPGFVELIDDPL